MVFDDNDQLLRSDQEEKRREKFSRERGGPDYMGGRGNRFGGVDRRDYNGIGGKKRPNRDDDYSLGPKRGKFDGAADSYEPRFVRKTTGEQTGPGGIALPQLLTFKSFLATQQDELSDEEAITKYEDYKMEFMKQECERYFQAHKEEEWFRLKYHPEQGQQRRDERRQNLLKRQEVFNEMSLNGRFDGLALSFENAEQLIRLLNEVVIKLEGGTNEDIEAANKEEIKDASILDLLTPEQLKQARANALKPKTEKHAENETNSMDTATAVEPEGTEEEIRIDGTTTQDQKPLAKRASLHKTQSIHFRSIPATVPLVDLENLCKQHPGFLRLAISDPVFDSKGQQIRTAWATYRCDVNIKDIYFALRTATLNGVELGVSLNRQLNRRVKTIGPTNALAGHRPVMQNDIRNAAKLIVLYDLRAGFYKEEAEEGEEQGTGEQDQVIFSNLEAAVVRSRNPLLTNIKDLMVEETSAEEETLMEKAAEVNGTEVTQEFETDQQLTKTLDILLFYLRLVHSVDFYASVEYSSEDDMPNRLGIIHVRGRPPNPAIHSYWPFTDAGVPLLPRTTVNKHITDTNDRLQSGLFKKVVLSESELAKLGKKDAEKAVEEFVNTNTQQLGPEKWLCPLSGKKFKGAEFVHKHLQSKYSKEIENARYEALYFNNFLADPNRPHNPIFVTKQSSVSHADRERSPSPQPVQTRRMSTNQQGADENVGGRQIAEANERIPYRGGDRYSGGGGGGNRFGYSGGRPFGPGSFGGPPRNNRPFYEPVNEMIPSLGGGGRRDPRAPPSYRDLDAPAEDII